MVQCHTSHHIVECVVVIHVYFSYHYTSAVLKGDVLCSFELVCMEMKRLVGCNEMVMMFVCVF